MEPKHSPLPWKVFYVDGQAWHIRSADNRDVVTTDCEIYTKAPDCELIVKSVNLFPRLVEFIENIRPFLGYDPEATLWKEAEKLLKEARGMK